MLNLLKESELGKLYKIYTSEKTSDRVKNLVLLSIGLKMTYYYLLSMNQ